MTTSSALPILGRPFDTYEGPDMDDLIEEHPELAEGTDEDDHEAIRSRWGFHALYQGNSYFGVQVSGGWDQGKPQTVESCAASWTPEEEARAREICDALPDSVKNRPDLLPFGAYFVGTDG